MVRLRLHRPLTPTQDIVARLVAEGKSASVIAERLGITEKTVRYHIREVAGQIPGSLPAKARIHVWWHGATEAVLRGGQ